MWFTLPCSTLPCLLTSFKQPRSLHFDAFWTIRSGWLLRWSGPASLQYAMGLHWWRLRYEILGTSWDFSDILWVGFSDYYDRREKTRVTSSHCTCLAPFFKSNQNHEFHIALSWSGTPCLSMSQLGLIKQLRVRADETASISKHPWTRREARAH